MLFSLSLFYSKNPSGTVSDIVAGAKKPGKTRLFQRTPLNRFSFFT